MDTLTKVQDEIGLRLAELRPAVEEVARLEAAQIALGGEPAAPARKTKRVKYARDKNKAGRPKGSGKRSALEHRKGNG